MSSVHFFYNRDETNETTKTFEIHRDDVINFLFAHGFLLWKKKTIIRVNWVGWTDEWLPKKGGKIQLHSNPYIKSRRKLSIVHTQ